jgi:nicotinamidase/pyrazinamidase
LIHIAPEVSRDHLDSFRIERLPFPMAPRLDQHDALLIVDVQNDFCPGGALPVQEGDRVVAVLNEWIGAARAAGSPVYASRDWHPAGHISFEERGGPWPRHCVQETPGAEFHPALDLPREAHVVSKGTTPDRDAYSAFEGTGLAEQMREEGVRRVWIGGLALDVCVLATALEALREGFEAHLIHSAARPVNVQEGDGDRALARMRSAGVIIEEDGGARAG